MSAAPIHLNNLNLSHLTINLSMVAKVWIGCNLVRNLPKIGSKELNVAEEVLSGEDGAAHGIKVEMENTRLTDARSSSCRRVRSLESQVRLSWSKLN